MLCMYVMHAPVCAKLSKFKVSVNENFSTLLNFVFFLFLA